MKNMHKIKILKNYYLIFYLNKMLQKLIFTIYIFKRIHYKNITLLH